MEPLMNKRETQLKPLKEKVAHLLKTGKDRIARVQVVDLIKIEKTMEAYDLLRIYCERIVERLPSIESLKECPNDLKEAVASVIFASSRCADIPELKAVKKHLSAKYGKDFTSSATDVRPNCGVSPLLVEKLSSRPPDGPTKIQRLTAIAKEHNVQWDPESYEENYSQAPIDLLNGPSSFQGASYIPEQLPPTQQSLNYRSYFQAPARKVSPDSNSYGLDSTSQAPSDLLNGPSSFQGASYILEQLPPTQQSVNSAQYVSGFSPKQSWSMGFLDPMLAAQAVALFAEHVSVVARRYAVHVSVVARRFAEHVSVVARRFAEHVSVVARRFTELVSVVARRFAESIQGINSLQSPSFGSGDQRRQDVAGSTETNQHLTKGPGHIHSALNPVPGRSSFREESTKSSGREDLLVSGNSSSSLGEIPRRENSITRASHVHPKLPDYDTLRAHMLPLHQDYINRANHIRLKPPD